MFVSANPMSLFFFILTMFLALASVLYGTFISDRIRFKKLVCFLVIWNFLTTGIVLSGIIKESFVPFSVLLFILINVTAVFFGLSSFSKPYLALPTKFLVLFHFFRFPLELVLHSWSKTGTVPATMTWTGQNYDIISGLLSVFALFPVFQNKRFYWFFNVISLALLINVIRVVLMSSPLPFAWPLENPIQLLAYFPYHLVATVGVWLALVGHIVLTRKLL